MAWLQALVEENSFFEYCNTHAHASPGNRKKAFFCRECSQPLCKECVSEHSNTSCDPCNIIQVVKSGKLDAIKAEVLEKLMDVDDMEVYTINHDYVYCLQPREAKRPKGSSCSDEEITPFRCRSCWRKMKGVKSVYCSIRCKLKFKDVNIELLHASEDTFVQAPGAASEQGLDDMHMAIDRVAVDASPVLTLTRSRPGKRKRQREAEGQLSLLADAAVAELGASNVLETKEKPVAVRVSTRSRPGKRKRQKQEDELSLLAEAAAAVDDLQAEENKVVSGSARKKRTPTRQARNQRWGEASGSLNGYVRNTPVLQGFRKRSRKALPTRSPMF